MSWPLIIMAFLVGHWEVMCPLPRHFKHFIGLVFSCILALGGCFSIEMLLSYKCQPWFLICILVINHVNQISFRNQIQVYDLPATSSLSACGITTGKPSDVWHGFWTCLQQWSTLPTNLFTSNEFVNTSTNIIKKAYRSWCKYINKILVH